MSSDVTFVSPQETLMSSDMMFVSPQETLISSDVTCLLQETLMSSDVMFVSPQETLMSLEELAPAVTPKALCDLLSFAMTVNSPETAELNLPDFPIDNLSRAVRVLVSQGRVT